MAGCLQWGRIKLPWLRGFLSLAYGIASPDTFELDRGPQDEAASVCFQRCGSNSPVRLCG